MSVCLHDWRFWGDDPYVTCNYCGEIRDALTGTLVKPSSPAPAREAEGER